jgi:ABC-2 type transport system permease protein
MVMLLTMLCGFLPALNIVGEKEAGTMEQMNVTPITRFTFIFSKLLPYWIIGFIVVTIGFGLAWLVYGLVPAGSLGTIYLFAAIYILAVSGLGLVISNYSETMQQAMFVMYFFMMVLIMLSGLFTPVKSMPGWAQDITIFNPLKYFMQVMRMVYLKGSGITELTTQMLALLGFALFFNTWAVLNYRKTV